MSYTWFRVDSSIAGHPKELELGVALKDPNAIAYVLRLWSWMQIYAPLGTFPRSRQHQVEAFCRWVGEPGYLLSTLVRVGFLEADRWTFIVHDWPEHQGAMVEKSRRDAEVKAEKRKLAKLAREEAARAAHAPGAPTDGRTDGRDEQKIYEPTQQEDRSGETEVSHNPPVENRPDAAEAHWGTTAERLVAWMVCERDLRAEHELRDRPTLRVDVDTATRWAFDWCLKYHPDEIALEQMHRAFLDFLGDPKAPAGKSLSVWCAPDVSLHRWDVERARDPRTDDRRAS